MKTRAQRFTYLLLAASAVISLFSVSCSTVRGVGRDVEKTGEGIQHAASHH